MKYLLNEEVKKMQRLAGVVPSKSLFEKFIDGETEYKTLREFMSSLNEETTQAAIDGAKEYLEKLEDQGQGNIIAAGEKVANAMSGINTVTRDKTFDKINTRFKNLNDQIKKSIFGATMALVILANSLGPSIPVGSKTYTVKTKEGTELVQANKKLNKNLEPIVGPDQNDLDQASNQNPEYDDSTTNTDLHIQHKTGESGINQQDNQQMDDYADAVASTVLDDGIDVDVTVKSGVSKQADKFSNVSKSGGKLDQERNDEAEKQITDKLEKSFKDKGAKVTKTGDGLKVEKDGKTRLVKITKKLINWKKNKTTSANNENPTQASEFTAKATSADVNKVVKDLKFLDFVDNPRLPGEIPVKRGGNDKPRPTGDDKEPGVERPISTGNSDPEDAEKLVKNKSLNRNQEIFSVLKMSNPNIKGDPNDKTYKSWDDNTKKIVIDLRKSPDTLLKKFQSVTGINLTKRQKSTGPFKRSGLAESIMLEAAIDDKLATIGVSDEAIRKNKVEVMAMLMKMYNLSYADIPKEELQKLTPEENKTLVNIVEPIPVRNTPKISSDVTAINKDIESNNSLKTALSRIDNEEELADLLVASVKYVNKDFQKSSEDNAAFNDVAKEVPKFYTTSTSLTPKTFNYSVVKEEETVEQDVINVEKIIDKYPTLKNHLEKINNREKLKQFILNVIFPNIASKLAQNQSRISTAIQKARNILVK